MYLIAKLNQPNNKQKPYYRRYHKVKRQMTGRKNIPVLIFTLYKNKNKGTFTHTAHSAHSEPKHTKENKVQGSDLANRGNPKWYQPVKNKTN